jgi:hypothetical protein
MQEFIVKFFKKIKEIMIKKINKKRFIHKINRVIS